jgi:hypothetical protein
MQTDKEYLEQQVFDNVMCTGSDSQDEEPAEKKARFANLLYTINKIPDSYTPCKSVILSEQVHGDPVDIKKIEDPEPKEKEFTVENRPSELTIEFKINKTGYKHPLTIKKRLDAGNIHMMLLNKKFADLEQVYVETICEFIIKDDMNADKSHRVLIIRKEGKLNCITIDDEIENVWKYVNKGSYEPKLMFLSIQQILSFRTMFMRMVLHDKSIELAENTCTPKKIPYKAIIIKTELNKYKNLFKVLYVYCFNSKIEYATLIFPIGCDQVSI